MPALSAAPAFNVASDFAPTKFTFLLGLKQPQVLVDREPDRELHLLEPLRYVPTVRDDQVGGRFELIMFLAYYAYAD